jgi:hypothetical protein
MGWMNSPTWLCGLLSSGMWWHACGSQMVTFWIEILPTVSRHWTQKTMIFMAEFASSNWYLLLLLQISLQSLLQALQLLMTVTVMEEEVEGLQGW